jgi:hypothetical protein
MTATGEAAAMHLIAAIQAPRVASPVTLQATAARRRPCPVRGREPEEQFEVVAHVGELGGQVLWFVHCADEDEAALEDGEDVVGEGGQVYGQGGRMHSGRGFELLEQPLAPVADGVGDQVARAVAGELVLVDERNEQAARLGGGKLRGDLFELPDEGDELLRRVVGLGLGLGDELLEQALIGRGVALEQGEPELVLGGEVVEETSLAGRCPGDHGVDARGGKATLEHESLGDVENPLAIGGSVTGHGNQHSEIADRLVCLI